MECLRTNRTFTGRIFQGRILGSFFYGYVLTQVPGGRLAELFGGTHNVHRNNQFKNKAMNISHILNNKKNSRKYL
jgi:hypothetical protein